jgi:hypothetical protein
MTDQMIRLLGFLWKNDEYLNGDRRVHELAFLMVDSVHDVRQVMAPPSHLITCHPMPPHLTSPHLVPSHRSPRLA